MTHAQHIPTHECGGFAGFNHPNAPGLAYFGLFGLEHRGSIFQTTVDSEIILHLLAQPADNGASNVLAALRKVQGAFSLVIMSEREIIGVRDPFGFRPLSLGRLDGAHILSSETCAFD